jgi:hypothetical protein
MASTMFNRESSGLPVIIATSPRTFFLSVHLFNTLIQLFMPRFSSRRDECWKIKQPFFFKQWGQGSKDAKRAGRTIDGRTWAEMPANLVRA